MPERRPGLTALAGAERIGEQPLPELTLGEMPLDPAVLRSLGKPIAELLGAVFTTPTGSGLPKRLRLTNWDARAGNVQLHATTKAGTPFEVKPTDLDKLIGKGVVDLEQPSAAAVAKVRAILSKLLPSP